ncbi:MAG: transcription antiterminator, partial [Lachnospiraceae bacterium]|nr:transcription antiterminator [Lachnospiraceae bacterium]
RSEGEVFIPLAPKEADWLERITEGGTEAEISQVAVAEGDTVTILSGPLRDMEGKIRKIHLHRRIAEVEVDFMNRKTVIHLGIELVGREEE